MKAKNIAAAGALMISLALPANVMGATATGRMNVRMAIQAFCEVISATDLDFGAATNLATVVDQSSTVTIKCSNTTPYNVGINSGTGGGTVSARRMVGGGGEYITYGLYRDAARSQAWGDTVGSDTATGTGTGGNQSFTVYGRVNSQTVPTPGNYSDVVTVTITY